MSIEDKMRRLIASYPLHLERFERGELVWKDNTRMRVDDGKTDRTFRTLLRSADIVDQFALVYRREVLHGVPNVNADPGRFRNAEFFRKMYGDCRNGEVEGNLVEIPWVPKHGGGTVRVTRINDVAGRLKSVSDALDELPSDFAKYLRPSGGGFNCRMIAGEEHLSPHAFGIAIDINVEHSHYWRWSKDKKYRNRIPAQIVDVFERFGFIWGGRWYHFDTMHFEYRPELMQK